MPDVPGSVYLLIPLQLEEELLAPLRAHFAADERVEVVVERRSSERRRGVDDRILRDLSRPETERRAQTLPRGIPPLPPELEHRAGELRVVQRLSPVRATLADLGVLDVVERAQAGDPEAPTEILWRIHERVSRRLAMRLGGANEAEPALRGAYGLILDRIGEFDPDVLPLDAWLDRMVDEHAERVRTAR